MSALSIGELVAAIRERTGQSQEELARMLGVSFATVNAWERGRTQPHRRHQAALRSLADDLGIEHRLTVLVIDDEPDACDLVAALLTTVPHDVEVLTATNGVDGLLLTGTRTPELVLLDIRMPGMDGFEVARAMRRRIELRDTELVLVTAHREPEWATLTDQAGADDLVEKPLTAEVVGALVERAAQRVQQRVADRLARQVETPAV